MKNRMKCQSCGGTRFTSECCSQVQASELSNGLVLNKCGIQIQVIITCQLCTQLYSGIWNGKVVVPMEKTRRVSYPKWVVEQATAEFGTGWDIRHSGRHYTGPNNSAGAHGWTAADKWAADKKGRPPMLGGWKTVVEDYLETEEACRYMARTVTDQIFQS